MAAPCRATILTDEPFGWREMVGCVLILGAGFAEARDRGHDVATKSSIGVSS